jgi:hypothetical protein
MILLTLQALIHTSALLTVVSITVNSILFGGNWSRPSGNTDKQLVCEPRSSLQFLTTFEMFCNLVTYVGRYLYLVARHCSEYCLIIFSWFKCWKPVPIVPLVGDELSYRLLFSNGFMNISSLYSGLVITWKEQYIILKYIHRCHERLDEDGKKMANHN